jgi:hypothetical protein
MLEFMMWLECKRQRLRKKMLPVLSDNSYHLIGSVLALLFAAGSLGTAIPSAGVSYVAFLVTGVLAILTIVLWPIGLVLL